MSGVCLAIVIKARCQMPVYGGKGWVSDVCLVMKIKVGCQMSAYGD